MLNRLYQWTLAKAAHRHAERWLFAVSFMESSFCSNYKIEGQLPGTLFLPYQILVKTFLLRGIS